MKTLYARMGARWHEWLDHPPLLLWPFIGLTWLALVLFMAASAAAALYVAGFWIWAFICCCVAYPPLLLFASPIVLAVIGGVANLVLPEPTPHSSRQSHH